MNAAAILGPALVGWLAATSAPPQPGDTTPTLMEDWALAQKLALAGRHVEAEALYAYLRHQHARPALSRQLARYAAARGEQDRAACLWADALLLAPGDPAARGALIRARGAPSKAFAPEPLPGSDALWWTGLLLLWTWAWWPAPPSPSGGRPSPSGGRPSPSGGRPSPSGGRPSPAGGRGRERRRWRRAGLLAATIAGMALHASHRSPDRRAGVNRTPLAVHQAPSTSSPVQAELPAVTSLRIAAIHGEWAELSHPEAGWVPRKNLLLAPRCRPGDPLDDESDVRP